VSAWARFYLAARAGQRASHGILMCASALPDDSFSDALVRPHRRSATALRNHPPW